MPKTVDYYHFLISPWSYLASGRLDALRERGDARFNYKPIDVMKTFADMGGVPPAKRHPSRQRFRMDELKRWSRRLDVPMNLTPAHFPTDQTRAAHLVYAAGGAEGSADAARLSDALLRAVWAEERDIADEGTLGAILGEGGFDAEELFGKAAADDIAKRYADTTAEAHRREVFGSPTWVLDGENFWGQDRLDFLEEALA